MRYFTDLVDFDDYSYFGIKNYNSNYEEQILYFTLLILLLILSYVMFSYRVSFLK